MTWKLPKQESKNLQEITQNFAEKKVKSYMKWTVVVRAIMFSGCLFVRLSHFRERDISRNTLTEFLQIWHKRPRGLNNELIRFWGSKVKVIVSCS